MTTYLVKVFDNKNNHLDTLEVESKTKIGTKKQIELIGYCKIFVNSKSALLEITTTYLVKEIQNEILEIKVKLEKLETGKNKLSSELLIIQFDKVINCLYFRIKRLKN